MEEGEEKEMYRLLRDNNRMLRSMRRNAFIWGIVKLLFYIGILVVLPFWLYTTYVAPVAEQALDTLGNIQGAGTNAQMQIGELQNLLNQLDLSKLLGQ